MITATQAATRFASLIVAAVITTTMLAGIDSLAVSQHADVALAKVRATGAQMVAVAVAAARS